MERGVQSIEGQVRALLIAFEGRVGREADPRWPIVAFIPEYAAYLLNRLEVGKDGKTAYERIKGKAAKVQGLEFGEAVLWKRKREAGPLGKLTSMWGDGIFWE